MNTLNHIINTASLAVLWFFLITALFVNMGNRLKTNTALFLLGASILQFSHLYIEGPTATVLNLMLFQATVMLSLPYLKFTLSRDIVDTAHAAKSAIQNHWVAFAMLTWGTYQVISSLRILL